MKPLYALLLLFISVQPIHAQDTLRVSLQEFIDRGLERSGQLDYEYGAVDLAKNRIEQARASRILPSVSFNTNHGLVPGVHSRNDQLDKNEYYLDPDLENDWENWAIFTRAELEAVQPVFAWGAVNKAIQAAEFGARAAEQEFLTSKQNLEVQLYELYYSFLLALEVERVLRDAEETIEQVEEQIEQMREEEDPNLKEKDVFQFEIYRSEFRTQQTEVEQSRNRIERIWRSVLGEDPASYYLPEESFLDPVAVQLEPFDYYQQMAADHRPELKGAEAGIQAYEHSIEALKSQQLPMVYLGLTASFANTPNRPRQSNPFIINNTNYLSGAVGFGIRQNLNFSSMRNRLERERISYNRVRDLREALSDGIMLELNESYMEAVVAESRLNNTEEALATTRNWVRHEQLNYDYGFGEVEDLIDSVRKELELRVTLKQNVFDLNKKVAALYKASGIPIKQLGSEQVR